jgi:hypothetical protein
MYVKFQRQLRIAMVRKYDFLYMSYEKCVVMIIKKIGLYASESRDIETLRVSSHCKKICKAIPVTGRGSP